MPRIQDPNAIGQSCFIRANLTGYPTTPATMEIYCPAHVPRGRAASKGHWLALSEKEACEKRLICHTCRTFLATGGPAPLLSSIFTRALNGDPALALWTRSYSWIIASGFQRWIELATIPEDLWVYMRLVLLEQLVDRKRLPGHVTLEVELRHGSGLETTLTGHLDSTGYTGDLVTLMHTLRCERRAPLGDRHAPELGTRELRTRFCGIFYDPAASERVAEHLKEVFGPFTLEWLYTAKRLYSE